MPSKTKSHKTSKQSKRRSRKDIKKEKMITQNKKVIDEIDKVIKLNKNNNIEVVNLNNAIQQQEDILNKIHQITSRDFSNFYVNGFHQAFQPQETNDHSYTITLPFGQSITIKSEENNVKSNSKDKKDKKDKKVSKEKKVSKDKKGKKDKKVIQDNMIDVGDNTGGIDKTMVEVVPPPIDFNQLASQNMMRDLGSMSSFNVPECRINKNVTLIKKPIHRGKIVTIKKICQ